jgi:hypothetical protein
VSALKISFLILAGVAISVFAQTPSDQSGQLPSQATKVEGVVVPVPKEIFHSLDEFRGANWRAVQQPEVVYWKSHGDQVQIAILLGVEIAEGFIAIGAGFDRSKKPRQYGVEAGARARSREGRAQAQSEHHGKCRQERMDGGTQ